MSKGRRSKEEQSGFSVNVSMALVAGAIIAGILFLEIVLEMLTADMTVMHHLMIAFGFFIVAFLLQRYLRR